MQDIPCQMWMMMLVGYLFKANFPFKSWNFLRGTQTGCSYFFPWLIMSNRVLSLDYRLCPTDRHLCLQKGALPPRPVTMSLEAIFSLSSLMTRMFDIVSSKNILC